MLRRRFSVLIALLMLGTLRGETVFCRFGAGGWRRDDWILVKSPRWTHVGDWVQEADCIVNRTPSGAAPADLLRTLAAQTYTSMVFARPVRGPVTVSATLAYDDRMAPLIVLAPTLGQDAEGRPEYREHHEIVLYDQGINVWHHTWKDGKPGWRKAAYWTFPLEPKTRYRLQVEVTRSARGTMMIVKVDGREMGYMDDSLPEVLHVGITGCEGVNRFYDFAVTGELGQAR